ECVLLCGRDGLGATATAGARGLSAGSGWRGVPGLAARSSRCGVGGGVAAVFSVAAGWTAALRGAPAAVGAEVHLLLMGRVMGRGAGLVVLASELGSASAQFDSP